MLEEQRRDPEVGRVELVEDSLRVVGAVVVSDTRMVAPDDEVRAAVVLARHRVEDRLARPGVPHRRRKDAEHDAIFRIVVVDEHLIALHARRRRDVVALGLADERVQQQAVADLERRLLDVFVRAMNRIPRLESDDPAPSTLGEERARRCRIAPEFRKRLVGRTPQHSDWSGHEHVALFVQARYARVRRIFGPIHAVRLAPFVVRERLRHVHRRHN